MKLHKTTEVIDALIGPIHPTGDSGEDKQRFHNLEDLIEVMREYMSRIENVAEQKDVTAYSMQMLGQRAYEFRKTLIEYDK